MIHLSILFKSFSHYSLFWKTSEYSTIWWSPCFIHKFNIFRHVFIIIRIYQEYSYNVHLLMICWVPLSMPIKSGINPSLYPTGAFSSGWLSHRYYLHFKYVISFINSSSFSCSFICACSVDFSYQYNSIVTKSLILSLAHSITYLFYLTNNILLSLSLIWFS